MAVERAVVADDAGRYKRHPAGKALKPDEAAAAVFALASMNVALPQSQRVAGGDEFGPLAAVSVVNDRSEALPA